MDRLFSKPISKAIVDILLIAGIIVSIISSRRPDAASWGSFHCIASMTWYALILVHIWQHWRLTKAFAKPKVMRRNIITTMTIIVFIMMTVTIVIFVFDTGDRAMRIHHQIAHFFYAMMIIHTIQKSKQFVRLFMRLPYVFTSLVWN